MTTQTFEINIDTDNAAFDGEAMAPELSRILREVADQIDNGNRNGRTRDSNGNTVGLWGARIE